MLCPFFTYTIHVNTVGVGPGVLEVLLQSLAKATWDLMEADELFDSQHLGVVASCTRVQPLDNGRNIPKYAGIHESYHRKKKKGK